MMVSSLVFWLILGFIMVKEVLFQIHFWILSVWLYAISCTAISSGRQVVEAKMLQKEKEKRGQDHNISQSSEAGGIIQLPDEEKTTYWKLALIAYSMALPLVCASPFQYYLTNMRKDVNCDLVQLAHSSDQTIYGACLDDYWNNPSEWDEQAGFRHPAYMWSMFGPIAFLLVEICLNQLLLLWKHIIFQYLFTLAYMIVTMVLSMANAEDVFVSGFDWHCLRGSDTEVCAWGDLGRFFGLLLTLQTCFFVLGLGLHVIK